MKVLCKKNIKINTYVYHENEYYDMICDVYDGVKTYQVYTTKSSYFTEDILISWTFNDIYKHQYNFNDHFYTKKELRKLKLKQLNKNN